MISNPPTTFDMKPFGSQWFQWNDIDQCFWPGRGKRSHKVNPKLAPAGGVGGVYLLARSKKAPPLLLPKAPQVLYIGQTNWFKRRLEQFGDSAGFWEVIKDGHSAAWRWEAGAKDDLWIALFEIGNDLEPHMAVGLRCWMEAVALEEHLQANGKLPIINKEELKEEENVLAS